MVRSAFGNELVDTPEPNMDELLDASNDLGVVPVDDQGNPIINPTEGGDAPVPEPTDTVAPTGTVEQPSVETGEEPAEGVAPSEPISFAGNQFASWEEVEKSYANMRLLQTQTAERLRSIEPGYAEAQRAINQFATQVIPDYERLRQKEAQGGFGPAQAGLPAQDLEELFSDPTKLQAYIRSEIANGVAAGVQQMGGQLTFQQQQAQEEFNQRQYWDRAADAAASFLRDHPSISPDDETDQMMNSLAQTLGNNVDRSSRETLDFLYEAVQNPQLGEVLTVNPHLAGTDQGRRMARSFAVSLGAGAPNGTTPAQTPATGQRPRAHVETGGTGVQIAGAPGERPGDGENDPIAAILRMADDDRKGKSIFTRS